MDENDIIIESLCNNNYKDFQSVWFNVQYMTTIMFSLGKLTCVIRKKPQGIVVDIIQTYLAKIFCGEMKSPSFFLGSMLPQFMALCVIFVS